jgi:glutamate-ammonia-ligase adenylyltransferase
MLAVSVEAFADYQRNQAWTWEHMALARARPIFGSEQAKARLVHIIDEILRIDRDPKKVTADAVKMRMDIARHKPSQGDLDVKLGHGGLVDLEFAIHVLQLTRHQGLEPNVGRAAEQLGRLGIIDPEVAEAHKLLTRMLITLRLVAPDLHPSAETQVLMAKACGAENWQELLARHDAARQCISALWNRVKEG